MPGFTFLKTALRVVPLALLDSPLPVIVYLLMVAPLLLGAFQLTVILWP
jgi:hypothetical protein